MKQRNRKRFNAKFKAKVALAAVQEKESLTQLGKRHGIHPQQVGQWKRQLLDRAPAAFEAESSRDTDRREDELLRKIGELTVERDFFSRGLQGSR